MIKLPQKMIKKLKPLKFKKAYTGFQRNGTFPSCGTKPFFAIKIGKGISWVQVHLIAWPHKFGNSSHFFQPWLHKDLCKAEHLKISRMWFLFSLPRKKNIFFPWQGKKHFCFLGEEAKGPISLGESTVQNFPSPTKGTPKLRLRCEH